MIRTQIYLTRRERSALEAIARRTERSQSELIREAIDAMIDRSSSSDRLAFLAAGRGVWADRTDLPDFEELREEMDRFPNRHAGAHRFPR